MVDISNLISHRFRGFSEYENTIGGIEAALDFGVRHLEFDIRVALCGTPMIYHDEYTLDAQGKVHKLCEVKASEFHALGGVFRRIPSAYELFAAVAAHKNKNAQLLIDIKDAGFEREIQAIVRMNGLQGRVTYVSWVPEALYAMHALEPDADYCLSYWCKKPGAKIHANHKVFSAAKGHVKRPARQYVHGERSGWFIDGALQGELRNIVTSICVPQDMVTRALVENYHKDGIKVSTFSYIDWEHIKDHKERFNIDLYFIDNKKVFDAL